MRYLNIDMDDVLVDFSGSLRRLTGLCFRTHPHLDVWNAMDSTPGFYRRLSVHPDAYRLLDLLFETAPGLGLTPRICTAVPHNGHCVDARHEKLVSIDSHFRDYALPVVFSKGSENKWLHAQPSHVLIDDYGRNCVDWVTKGRGLAFHYDPRPNTGQTTFEMFKSEWLRRQEQLCLA